MVKLRPDFASTNDTPYLALTGELWGVFCEIYKKNDRDISRAHCIALKWLSGDLTDDKSILI